MATIKKKKGWWGGEKAKSIKYEKIKEGGGEE